MAVKSISFAHLHVRCVAPPRGPAVRADGLTEPSKLPPHSVDVADLLRAVTMGSCSPKIIGSRMAHTQNLQPEPFNFTPMAVSSISSGSPHVRPMGRTCGEPDEIKKNTHPKSFTALFRERTRARAPPAPCAPRGTLCSSRTRRRGTRPAPRVLLEHKAPAGQSR